MLESADPFSSAEPLQRSCQLFDDRDETSLWLARALFDVGAINFGDFSLTETTKNSPVYVNPRKLISEPAVLKRIARLIEQEVKAAQSRRRPRVSPFSLVAGVPFGGLHLATAFSLLTEVPMVYVRPAGLGNKGHEIEGSYRPGQVVLIIDDLISQGGSVSANGGDARGVQHGGARRGRSRRPFLRRGRAAESSRLQPHPHSQAEDDADLLL